MSSNSGTTSGTTSGGSQTTTTTPTSIPSTGLDADFLKSMFVADPSDYVPGAEQWNTMGMTAMPGAKMDEDPDSQNPAKRRKLSSASTSISPSCSLKIGGRYLFDTSFTVALYLHRVVLLMCGVIMLCGEMACRGGILLGGKFVETFGVAWMFRSFEWLYWNDDAFTVFLIGLNGLGDGFGHSG
ncbi:hypothetical protein THAOC_29572, partial [Thalassiosira oceanica]